MVERERVSERERDTEWLSSFENESRLALLVIPERMCVCVCLLSILNGATPPSNNKCSHVYLALPIMTVHACFDVYV